MIDVVFDVLNLNFVWLMQEAKKSWNDQEGLHYIFRRSVKVLRVALRGEWLRVSLDNFSKWKKLSVRSIPKVSKYDGKSAKPGEEIVLRRRVFDIRLSCLVLVYFDIILEGVMLVCNVVLPNKEQSASPSQCIVEVLW